jgi:DNA-binding NarL/FixJ family response regulator
MTKREWEVVALIAEGLSNKEMGERLHIALHTVKSHMHNVLEKLSLHSRLQVAAYVHGDKGPAPPFPGLRPNGVGRAFEPGEA